MPGALPAEVKRAYRRLAMQWHPDRNPAPEAVERFRQVRAAYDYLLDGGEADEDTAGAQSEPPPEAPPRGPDQHERLWLTIEEAIFGTAHEFELGASEACGECDGTGRIDLGRSRLCEDCHGSGRIRTPRGLAQCASCAGRGYVSVVACAHCDGSGQIRAARRVRVTVPPLMWPGRGLRLSGQADAHEGLPPGDLLLVAHLKPHLLYQVDGDGLHLRLPVSAFTLMAGGTLPVPVPGGWATVTVAAGAPMPSEQWLAGHGLPHRDGGRGPLRVSIEPVWPEVLEADDAAALARLQAHFDARMDTVMPTLAQWQGRWLGTGEPAGGGRGKTSKSKAGKRKRGKAK